MHVFMRYGRTEIDLGELPILPILDDKIRLVLPPEKGFSDGERYLTVGQRIFEQRRSEWVCVLTSREVA